MDENIARDIFRKYRGMYFFMMREGNGDYELYKSYNISRQQEISWLTEMQSEFMESFSHTQCSRQLLDALSKYIDVTKELHDQSSIWNLCDYIEQNALNWDISTTLMSVAILFRAKGIIDYDKVAFQNLCSKIDGILIKAMRTAKDASECDKCQKTIQTLREKGIIQIYM